MQDCVCTWLGRRPYRPTWDLQQQLVQARIQGRVPNVLLFVEHPPTYTLGRRGDPANLLVAEAELARQGTEFVPVDRGGDITYHGPGQLVGYPILDLAAWNSDLHLYVRKLEEVLIRALAGYGLAAERIAGLTGVWVGGNKVAAIGVKVSRGVTSHGFALNVTTDLGYFSQIIPCGIMDHGVTSLAALLGTAPAMAEVRERVAAAFGEVFELRLAPIESAELEGLLDAGPQR
ncbi:MAG: lipoyl(octanoyl) transferase LipB [Symbiobacteriia bacterium]